MPKFFIFSDCHGYCDELKSALDKSGFDPNNEDHWIVGLGDYMDRGRQPQQVMNYLMSLPRKILVLGNHEELLLDCIDRGYPLSHDWHNGTAQTIIDLAPNAETFDVACSVAYEKVKDFIGSMVNYVELQNYIGVHSFVPLKCNDDLPAYHLRDGKFERRLDWRDANDKEWSDARWGNPYELAEWGLLPDKTLMFGHFHTSYPRAKYEGQEEFGETTDFSPYYGDGYIAIDGCVAADNGQINVITIKDDWLEGAYEDGSSKQ